MSADSSSPSSYSTEREYQNVHLPSLQNAALNHHQQEQQHQHYTNSPHTQQQGASERASSHTASSSRQQQTSNNNMYINLTANNNNNGHSERESNERGSKSPTNQSVSQGVAAAIEGRHGTEAVMSSDFLPYDPIPSPPPPPPPSSRMGTTSRLRSSHTYEQLLPTTVTTTSYRTDYTGTSPKHYTRTQSSPIVSKVGPVTYAYSTPTTTTYLPSSYPITTQTRSGTYGLLHSSSIAPGIVHTGPSYTYTSGPTVVHSKSNTYSSSPSIISRSPTVHSTTSFAASPYLSRTVTNIPRTITTLPSSLPRTIGSTVVYPTVVSPTVTTRPIVSKNLSYSSRHISSRPSTSSVIYSPTSRTIATPYVRCITPPITLKRSITPSTSMVSRSLTPMLSRSLTPASFARSFTSNKTLPSRTSSFHSIRPLTSTISHTTSYIPPSPVTSVYSSKEIYPTISSSNVYSPRRVVLPSNQKSFAFHVSPYATSPLA